MKNLKPERFYFHGDLLNHDGEICWYNVFEIGRAHV